jgi:hypothetical protein
VFSARKAPEGITLPQECAAARPMKKIRCVLKGRIVLFMVQCNIKLITGYYQLLTDY